MKVKESNNRGVIIGLKIAEAIILERGRIEKEQNNGIPRR